MTYTLDELSPDELAVVEKYRAQRDKERKHKELSREILKVAYEYLMWLQANGVWTSYSTFCNEFGYEGEYRRHIYETVTSLVGIATETSSAILE